MFTKSNSDCKPCKWLSTECDAEPEEERTLLTHNHYVELKSLLHGLPPHLLQNGIYAHIAEVHHRTTSLISIQATHRRGHHGIRHHSLRHGTAAVAWNHLWP